jgi:hypothetical protein
VKDFKTPFTLFRSSVCGNFKNRTYEKRAEVKNLEDLKTCMGFDHVMGEFKENYRKKANWIGSNVLYFDLDNGETEEPDEWIGMEDIPDLFPDVEIVLQPSRNHMKDKIKEVDGKSIVLPARPKFHGYCPLKTPFDDAVEMEKYLRLMVDHYPEVDRQVTDCSRLFCGSRVQGAQYITGEMDMVEFLNYYLEDVENGLN